MIQVLFIHHFQSILSYSNNSILNGPYRPHANDYRKIKLKNAFPFTISLFFDNEVEYGKDSVIGDYLGTRILKSNFELSSDIVIIVLTVLMSSICMCCNFECDR